MSDSNIPPLKQFERMNYFLGQLLKADHFKSEQEYMNEKRQLINRLTHGKGILIGLEVKQEEARSIKITSGVALDGFGREIVVSEDRIESLDELDSNMGYVCLKYDQKEIDPVPSTDPCSRQECCNYNRFEEYFLPSFEPTRPQGKEELVELACVELDNDGNITNIEPTGRYLYNNALLHEKFSKMEEEILKMKKLLEERH